MPTNADLIIRALLDAGVSHLFGMPGGGSNIDLIEAAGRAGLPFTLAQTEVGSAFMASAQAEITGKPGACIATLGPGAASIVNGVANACLDRVPLIVITDCHPESVASVTQHQTLRHGEIFSSVTKRSIRLKRESIVEAMRMAIGAATTPPCGPVHLDVSTDVTAATAMSTGQGKDMSSCCPNLDASIEPLPENVQKILKGSRRPIFLVGLEARTKPISSSIQQVCERFRIPALVTYKAKGVVPDRHSYFGGVLTNGALEREILERADLFLAIGLDPVELLPKPWNLTAPVIGIAPRAMGQKQISLLAEFVGDVAEYLQASAKHLPSQTDWTESEVTRLAAAQQQAMRPENRGTLISPHRVVEIAAEIYPGTRITVDAGAHMFPVMSLWPAENPCDVLISNGLSTMGFALPAAIGACLLDPSKPVLAFTGDGGLLICLSELHTAVREKLPLRVIVFDDCALSLIKIKQIQRGYRCEGVDLGEIDWMAVGQGLGAIARKASNEAEFRAALTESTHHPGPVLIAARIAPEAYVPTIRALRG